MSGPVGDLRRVTINALTEAGWVAGSVHVPAQIKLEDYLNRASDFLALTEVYLEGRKSEIPFFALQRGAIHLLTSTELDEQQAPDEVILHEDHHVSCLFTVGHLKGCVRTKPGVRLSDILARHKTFVAVANCTYETRSPHTRETFREARSLVLLNFAWIIGLSEQPSRGPDSA